jgi:thiol-disulfide isomerase/thioredoxin
MAGQRELTVDPISVSASKLTLLKGCPAPELTGIVGWKGGQVKLANLKGKYVLLEFWSYWAGGAKELQTLTELHEKFAGKGLAIVLVHIDPTGEINTAAKFDEKIAGFKKDRWNGKDLPFPVALTSGKPIGTGDQRCPGETAGQFGATGFPCTILIDRNGKVVD